MNAEPVKDIDNDKVRFKYVLNSKKDFAILRVFKHILFLLLLITIACRRQKSTEGAIILFDAFKEQAWSIKDTGFAGYSSLNLFLKNLGFSTAENHKPYKEVLPNLDSKTLFVIGVAMEAKFTKNEVKDILDFVGRGGKLLVIAEHDNQFGSADFLRPLINAAGWEISNGRVVVESDTFPGTAGRWIMTSLPSIGEGPVLLCAADLTIIRKKGCEVLLTSVDGKHIVAGLGSYKKGQIAILTDSEFLWNANPDYKWKELYPLSFCDPKTRAFIKDLIFRILTPKELSEELSDFSLSENPQSSKRVFVYGNGGDFHNYSEFLAALSDANISVFKYQEGMKIAPKDRVIVIAPLKGIPQQVIDELSKSEKMLIFGDMYSSVKSYAESWNLFFKPCKIYPVPYPINPFAEKYGVRFLPYFGVNFEDNEHGNILYVPVFFNKKRLYLHKACAIELLTGNKNNKIYFENSEETFACKAGLGLNQPLKFKDPKDIENPDFLIATDNVLAVGDSDIITDVFFRDAQRSGFFEMIIRFLKTETDKNSDD